MSEMLRHYQRQRVRASQQRVKLVTLAGEYRVTMDAEVLHSWARDVCMAIEASDLP
jgi:hypothetical protein